MLVTYSDLTTAIIFLSSIFHASSLSCIAQALDVVLFDLLLDADDRNPSGVQVRGAIDLIEQLSSSNSHISTSFVNTAEVLIHVLFGEDTLASKEQVDLLKRFAGNFRVEKVDDRCGKNVHAGEEYEGSPAQT